MGFCYCQFPVHFSFTYFSAGLFIYLSSIIYRLSLFNYMHFFPSECTYGHIFFPLNTVFYYIPCFRYLVIILSFILECFTSSVFICYVVCCLKIDDISFSCTVPFINKAMELCGAEVPMVTARKVLMCPKTSISASANTESISDQTVLSKREDLLIKSLFTLPSSNTHPPSLSATGRGKIKG